MKLNTLRNHRIEDEDFVATISAKDFPERGEFRVYRVCGDVTRPNHLKAAIRNLLAGHGIGERRVQIAL